MDAVNHKLLLHLRIYPLGGGPALEFDCPADPEIIEGLLVIGFFNENGWLSRAVFPLAQVASFTIEPLFQGAGEEAAALRLRRQAQTAPVVASPGPRRPGGFS